jgi:SAM-dependent methyltransferase
MDERLHNEREFHNGQARARRAVWETDRRALRFQPEDYLDHEPWVRPALERLGPIKGKRVLDLGCGHGMAAVELARRGGQVVACDLSEDYVYEARERASANGVAVTAVVADGARLPFAGATFDAIWGVAILHHLPLAAAAREIKRILKPGGRAVFCEPWGGNPILRIARNYLPYPDKDRTVDEAPITRLQIRELRRLFSNVAWEPNQFLGMVRRLYNRSWLTSRLDRFDSVLLERWPELRNWCRYVLITLHP